MDNARFMKSFLGVKGLNVLGDVFFIYSKGEQFLSSDVTGWNPSKLPCKNQESVLLPEC